jgi:ABC-type oligopeptide transport system substrate-binding subunit
MRGAVRVKNGEPLDVVFVRQQGEPTAFADAVERQLATVGIHVSMKAFPVTLFNALNGPIRSGRFNVAVLGWIGGADPEQSVVFGCDQIGPDGNNIQRFCDTQFEAAFHDQAVTPDSQRRARDFMTMQRVVYDRLAIVPLYYYRYEDVVGSRVTGFARNMLAYPVNAQDWDAK